MPSPLDRSVSRHVALIATPAQLTTIGSRPRYALAFADDGTIQSITGADTLVTIPTTGTTASTNLVVEDTGTASVATVLTLSPCLSGYHPRLSVGECRQTCACRRSASSPSGCRVSGASHLGGAPDARGLAAAPCDPAAGATAAVGRTGRPRGLAGVGDRCGAAR